MKTQYDIFISYRREGGLEMADAINQRLINAGYAVFLDMEQLKACKFNEKLLRVISDCQDFLLILPPGALDRCSNPEDWVRREVECALQNKKNIIPFMLRGFEWPDIEKLPESLRELPNYNGIAASDHNVFIENIERLKRDFLHSKPGFSWRRYKKWVAVGALTIALAGGLGWGWHANEEKKFEAICQEQAMQIMTETTKMHNNVKLAENVLEAWMHFENDFEENSDEAREALREAVEFNRHQLHQPDRQTITVEVANNLRDHDIEMEELNAFQTIIDESYKEINNYMDNILLMAKQNPSEIFRKNARLSYDYVKKGFVANYLGVLGFYATMPKSIYPKLRESVPSLTYVSDIRLEMSEEECTTMQKGVIAQMEEIVNEMGGNLTALKHDVEILERKSQMMDEQMKRNYVDQRVEKLAQKQHLINQRKAEMAEMDQKMTKLYEDAMRVNKLNADDDLGIMWGKVLRMVRLAEIALKSELEVKERHDALVEISKQDGNGEVDFTPFRLTITSKDKFKNVDKWLAEFEQFNEDEYGVEKYVSAARAFYSQVSKNKLPADVGVIMVATKDNVSHPVYQIGDIVTACNGKKVQTVDGYFKMVKEAKNPVVTILRLVEGKLKSMEVKLPSENLVLTGFCELHEW